MHSNFSRLSICVLLLSGEVATTQAQSPVTFSVDMSAQTANASFDFAGGDQMQARGQFQGWTGGFWLTNSPAHTNIFSGTYQVTDSPGSFEPYKFVIIKAGDDANSWNHSESLDITDGNRSFTLAGGAQNVPLVYYNNQLPPGAAPVNPITFQVDMTAQIAQGNFHPENSDTVEARGDFELTPWHGGNRLTNSPANTNLYRGTFLDANYPGAQLAYKFVIVPGLNPNNPNFENLNNRVLIEPDTGGVTLPVAGFNNEFTYSPVTFSVDLSAEAGLGNFDANFDYVEAQGSFQSPFAWSGGFRLTNDPDAANPNLFSRTTTAFHAAGTVEHYKFVVDGGSGPLGWEKPVSTGGDDRTFTLAGGAQSLPVVYFNDLGPRDVLAQDTSVTFSVNMTNAAGTDSVIFNPDTDSVYINGDFLNWWSWGSTPAQYQLSRNQPGLVYNITLTVPRGNPVVLTYKYGINGNDDESSFKTNHIRYILTQGSYVMPQDTFGNQLMEPSFSASPIWTDLSNGQVTIHWNAVGGEQYQAQYKTNLTQPNWLNLGAIFTATNGAGRATDVGTNSARFYRVVLVD